MSTIGLLLAKSKLAWPYPDVVTRIPLLAPSFCKVPNRSRTAETPTVFLYLFAWITTLPPKIGPGSQATQSTPPRGMAVSAVLPSPSW
jgi:hypothetical protein